MRKAKDIPHDALNALKERISYFRGLAYPQLAIELKARDRDHLELTEFQSTTGQQYQLVIDGSYDDGPGGAIRIDGTVMEKPRQPLLGFLPVFISRSSDGFILTPEGTFLGEDQDAPRTDPADQANR